MSGQSSNDKVPHLGLTLLFTASLGLFGCRAEVPQWPELKAQIRAKWPDVEHISPAELEARMAQSEELLLIDVREAAEYKVSRIPGAVSLPEQASFREKITKLLEEQPEVKTVVLYCSVGYRSSRAAHSLASLPGKSVYNLEGSIFEWANDGLPIEGATVPPARVHPYDEHWGKLLKPVLRADLP